MLGASCPCKSKEVCLGLRYCWNPPACVANALFQCSSFARDPSRNLEGFSNFCQKNMQKPKARKKSGILVAIELLAAS